ncbi:MAG: tungstate ABC transporter substrate-binding protein WtpA [Anaerolineae bacterium]|nr:tungstate ABC transporter substrate-binding protein WtpA [Gemmatimonadaceae bacterium]
MAFVCATITTLALASCSSDAEREKRRPAEGDQEPGESVLVVYNAGSLARPLRAALDSFVTREKVVVEQESAGSLETARKLTELGKIPDIIALADYEVFPQLLMPEFATWYMLFAQNRMVIAYTDRSKHANEITPANWWEVLLKPGVETGRSEPALDPAGYRTLLVFQLAERHYHKRGLEGRLMQSTPARNIRPKEVDLVALLQAGELDYAWEYESVARAAGLRFVQLPHEIDLGSPGDSAFYGQASVRVPGKTPRDTITFRGEPIVYAFSIPIGAPHPAVAERFARYLMTDGKAVLRLNHLPALERPVMVGKRAPASISVLAGEQ